jgi:glycogen debranching enzyme
MRPSNYPIFAKHGVIDDYFCLWVQAVRELYDRTQDKQFLREVWPHVVLAMNYFLKRRTSNGLVYAGEFIYFFNPLAYVTCEGTSINAFIYAALLDAAYLADKIGDRNRKKQFDAAAKSLFSAVNKYLWNNKVGSYYGSIINYKEQK